MAHAFPARFSFRLKIAAAIVLIILADALFSIDAPPGATIGMFAAAWAVLVAAARRGTWVSRGALAAAAMALVYAAALFDDPSLIAVVLFWTALGLAVLIPRIHLPNALVWALPLLIHGLIGPFRPAMDMWRLLRLKRRPGRVDLRGIVALLALPVIGGALFIGLFAAANPLIAEAFERMRAPDAGRIAFWLAMLLMVWPMLRPWAGTVRNLARASARTVDMPSPPALAPPLASVLIALATFNAIFAVQNGLDIAFLWSGAPLPGTITLADYAHRGAYALIATALIAGGLALWMLRPGSATAAHRGARALLILWVAQNLLLVASSMLRTIDYVEVFSLTRLRIAALAWMLLVGIGLALICWRILRSKGAAWLVNANVATAGTLLTAACFVDLGAVAATWNVRHAREAGGTGPAIDLCYLDRLGQSALLPLIAIEPRIADPERRERAIWLRDREMRLLTFQQRDWRSWTWRGARRLAQAQTVLGSKLVQPQPPAYRDCGGAIPLPAPAPSFPPAAAPPPAQALVPGKTALPEKSALTEGTSR